MPIYKVTLHIAGQPNRGWGISEELGHVEFDSDTREITVQKPVVTNGIVHDLSPGDFDEEYGLAGATVVLTNRSCLTVARGTLGKNGDGRTVLLKLTNSDPPM